MTNYYEILQVSPTASPAEIEAAYEAQYNHWRRLVTHHEPEVVNRANRTLQMLEQVRTTLTDPNKRLAYDTRINRGPSIGGLTDPQSTPADAVWAKHPSSANAPSPPAPTPSKPDELIFSPEARVDAWVCPQCQTANQVQSSYCKKCGQQLGQACPDCGALLEAIAHYCPACGQNIKKALRRQELETQLAHNRAELAVLEQTDWREPTQRAKALRGSTVLAWAWMSFFLAFGFLTPFSIQRYGPLLNPDLISRTMLTPELLLGSLILGVQAAFVMIVMLARRTFKLWAVLAVVASGAVLYYLQYWSQRLWSYSEWGPPEGYWLFGGISLVWVLVALRLTVELRNYSRWVWLVFFIVLFIAPFTVVPVYSLDYYHDPQLQLVTQGFLPVLTLCFLLLGLRAWQITRRTEREVSDGKREVKHRMNYLKRENANLAHEVETLQEENIHQV